MAKEPVEDRMVRNDSASSSNFHALSRKGTEKRVELPKPPPPPKK
jgi:hypothetical protein